MSEGRINGINNATGANSTDPSSSGAGMQAELLNN